VKGGGASVVGSTLLKGSGGKQRKRGAGAVPERRCRPVAARPRWERAGGTCARGRRRTGEAGSWTSGPGATVTCGGGLNWIRMQVQTTSNLFKL
jgi:hypothetical protein